MLRFAHEVYLYALAAIPLFLILFVWIRIRKKRSLKKFGEASMITRLMPDVSGAKAWTKFIVLMLAFAFLVVGAADLQIGSKLEEVKREGVDVMIALDVSNSMNAEDIRPSRIERSKQAISKLIDNLQNDRIGIIVFAGKAFVQLPLTSDFGAAKLFLSSIDTDIISSQGTAIGSAIDLSMHSLDTKDKKHKVLVIITDGENHEDDAIEAAKAARKDGIIIHTIGMGSPQGAPIPIYRNNARVGFLKDNEDKVVITKLDESGLRQISKAGDGIFVRASNGDDGLKSILHEITRMEKKNYGSKVFTDYEDRFQYFLGIALLLLVIELLISERKSKWLQNINLFGAESKKVSKAAMWLLIGFTSSLSMLLMPATGHAQSKVRENVKKGNSEYKNGKYGQAEINYRKALEEDKTSQQAAFNLGDALYKQGKYEEAATQFQQITTEKGANTKLKAKAYHNLGNSYLKQKKLEESVNAYKNALKVSPNDQETKYNLAYAKALMQQQEQQKQQQNKNDKNKDKNKDQQKQNQQNKDEKNKENKDNQNKNEGEKKENKDEQKDKGAQQQPQKLSQEDAQRILDALNRKEKDKHKKLDKKAGQKAQIEKNW